jgi:hypothetical protein
MATRKVDIRLTAEDDTARGFRSVARRMRRLSRVASVTLGTLATSAITSGLSSVQQAVSSIFDTFDRAQKLGQILDIEPAVVRRLQLVGDLIGSSGEQLARLARRVRAVAQAGSPAQQEGLEALGLNLQEIAKSDAAEVLLAVGRAAEAAGTQAEGALTEAIGDRLSATAILLSKNLPQATREFRDAIDRDLNAAADDVADFNDTTRLLSQTVQNTAAKAFSDFQRLVGASVEQTRAFTKALGANVRRLNPFAGALLGVASVAKATAEAEKELNAELEKTADLLRFVYEEAPTRGRILLRQFEQQREKAIADRRKAEADAAKERQDTLDEIFNLEKDRQEQYINGLRAIIALEEGRGRGGIGIVGQGALQTSPAASPARQLLNQETQKKQLKTLENMLKVLKERGSTGAEFG